MTRIAKTALLCGLLAGSTVIWAESVKTDPPDVAIVAQSLSAALEAVGKQTGLQIVYVTAAVEGKQSLGAPGGLGAKETLQKVLEGTGLTYKFLTDKTVAIQVPKRAATAQAVLRRADAAGAVPITMAEEAPADSSAAQEPAERLEEIVVSGHRFLSIDTSGTTNLPLPIEKVPQSISIVSNDFIEAADLKTLGAIAEYTPGAINIGSPENTGTAIKLRGFGAGQSIDGINIASGGFEPDYAIYDRLEIVKGPSSVVYGVSSPGGLVNYVTKSATSQTPSYLFVQGGSWSSYRLEGQVAGALDEQGHVRAIGIVVQDQGDSFIHELYRKKTTLYGGLNVDLGNSITAFLHGGYERFKVPSFDGILSEADGSPAPVPRSFFIGSRAIGTTTDVYHAEGDMTWHATDMLDFSIKGNYQTVSLGGVSDNGRNLRANGDFDTFVFRYAKDSPTTNYGIGVSSIYRFDNFGLKNSFMSLAALYQSLDTHVNVTFSDFGQANIFDGQAAVSDAFNALLAGPLPYVDNGHTKEDTLTFSAQSILQVIEPLSVLLGVSYSKPKESAGTSFAGPLGPLREFNFPGQTSYRAGLTYEFLPKTYAYVSYSQSFNPQGALVCTAQTATSCLSSTLLPPLTGAQYEFGVKYRSASGRMLLTAAAFQIKEKNSGQYYATLGAQDYYQSVGEVTHKGIELQSIGQITPQWQINAGYAFLDPKITEGNPVLNNLAEVGESELFLPRQTASLLSTYTVGAGTLRGLAFGGGVRYVSDQRTSFKSALANAEAGLNSTKNLPGYTLVDLNVGYTLDKWLVQLNAHNVLDRHYFINNYQFLLYGNMVGDPASVALSIRRTF